MRLPAAARLGLAGEVSPLFRSSPEGKTKELARRRDRIGGHSKGREAEVEASGNTSGAS